MAELTFKSSLSIDEVEDNFKDMDFFSEIMDSLTEALAASKGQAAADTFTRKRSLPVVDICGTRKSLNMTQKGLRICSAFLAGRSKHGSPAVLLPLQRQRN